VTTGIPSIEDIEQQKEYVATLQYLRNERETEFNAASNNYDRAYKRWSEEYLKLRLMKEKYDQN